MNSIKTNYILPSWLESVQYKCVRYEGYNKLLQNPKQGLQPQKVIVVVVVVEVKIKML